MKTTMKISGMSCDGCRMGAENALKRVAVVASAKVSLEKGEAEVDFDEKKAALGDLKAAIEKAGFKAG